MARKAENKNNDKKDEGQKNKSSRVRAALQLNGWKGQEIAKLSAKEKEALLIVICQLLGLADDKGVIK